VLRSDALETVTGLAFQKVVTRKDLIGRMPSKIIRLAQAASCAFTKPRNCHWAFIFSSHASGTQSTLVMGGVPLMGMIMIRCPKTGQAISTDRYVEPAAFRSTAVFFSRTYCPLCRIMHEWFAKDAWVETAGFECAPEPEVA
jgi:hypothetical protein